MTISPLRIPTRTTYSPGMPGSSSATPSSYATAVGSVQAHALLPNDPLNQYLTDGDRSMIKAATGLDVRRNGDILMPVSMSVNDSAAAEGSAGQIAADRANGKLTGAMTDDYLKQIFKQYGYPAAITDKSSTGVDISV